MKPLMLAACLVIAAICSATADSVKVTVGHMCCGACKAAATAGVKNVAWADTVAIEGTVVTVTAKSGMKVDLVSLSDALNKCGFPAMEITTASPVTLTLAHLCCGGCVNDLKAKVANIRSQVLDKENVKVDQAAKTVTFQPLAGKELNVVSLLTQLQRQGFSASACTIVSASVGKQQIRASR
jgi:copper chaperone CopZ